MINSIKNRCGNSKDLVIKNIKLYNNKINIIFFETLCDSKNINDFVLSYISYLKINKNIILNINNYIKEFLPNYKVNEVYNIDEIITNLYNGFCIININNKYYALEFRKCLDSGITRVENEKTIKGPRDAFTENYQTNIGLIRKRIRNENLWLEEVNVGRKSNTRVGILYIKDICDESLVKDVKAKIKRIDIDTIPDSSYIYEMISNNKSLFPNVLSTERPDLVSFKLLNGKIAIVVDNTPFVILLPAFFIEFFHTMDDYFQNNINASFMRIIRIIAFIISVMLPGVYIALITYNQEILPPSLLINFAMQKEGVPFPTVLEALIMNITFEILRETDVRSPSALGSALSIVGALVLGDAAVDAGLVSPIMVIVIAITAISELIFSLNDVANAIKIWRIIFIIFAGISGMLGVFISLILLISELSSITSFNKPFLYPTSPLDLTDQGNDIILSKKYKLTRRNKLTAKKNITRGNI